LPFSLRGNPGRARRARPAADRIHRQARHDDLLPPGWVRPADLRDRLHPGERAAIFEAPLRRGHRPDRPRRAREQHELALDVADVLLDPRRRGIRLFLLQAGKRRLVLLIGEIDLDRAAREQRADDEREEEHRVLAQQAAARLHAITRSANTRLDGGIARPSARAVLRLITSSKREGCSTGSSEALPPLRMRTTNRAARWKSAGRYTP